MAKIRFFVAVLLMLAFRATAQNPSDFYEEIPRTFIGGVIAGTNFTQVDGDAFAGYHKIGFNVGGVVYANVAPHVAASIEILFSQKGANSHQAQRGGNGDIITDYNIALNYAEVPIQIHYFDKRKSHLGAGFSISRLISSIEQLVTQPENNLNLNDDYPFKKMDYNFVIGGNLKLWKGLFLNTRFQYSLLTIRRTTPPGYSRADQFNNMWTLRLMYRFD